MWNLKHSKSKNIQASLPEIFFRVQESDKGTLILLMCLEEDMATFKDSHLGKEKSTCSKHSSLNRSLILSHVGAPHSLLWKVPDPFSSLGAPYTQAGSWPFRSILPESGEQQASPGHNYFSDDVL